MTLPKALGLLHVWQDALYISFVSVELGASGTSRNVVAWSQAVCCMGELCCILDAPGGENVSQSHQLGAVPHMPSQDMISGLGNADHHGERKGQWIEIRRITMTPR